MTSTYLGFMVAYFAIRGKVCVIFLPHLAGRGARLSSE